MIAILSNGEFANGKKTLRFTHCVSLVWPFSVGDCPTVIFLRNRSQVSYTRCQVMVEGSMSRREKRVNLK